MNNDRIWFFIPVENMHREKNEKKTLKIWNFPFRVGNSIDMLHSLNIYLLNMIGNQH